MEFDARFNTEQAKPLESADFQAAHCVCVSLAKLESAVDLLVSVAVAVCGVCDCLCVSASTVLSLQL